MLISASSQTIYFNIGIIYKFLEQIKIFNSALIKMTNDAGKKWCEDALLKYGTLSQNGTPHGCTKPCPV